MAKVSESKSDAKRFQKEIASLKAKLKVAEKKAKSSDKSWAQKLSTLQKAHKSKLAETHKSGYTAGVSESAKKESARKKALKIAEAKFDSEYKKSSPKATAKGKVKSKKAKTKRVAKVSKKTTVVAKKAKKTKALKSHKVVKAAVNTKKRGRPASKKIERIQPEVLTPTTDLF